MAREVPVGKHHVTIVDDDDYELAARHKWLILKTGNVRYAISGGRQRTLYLHREIMKATPGVYVDHINHDGLDNRKCNLRICTHVQNHANRRPNKGRKFRGVRPNGEYFHAFIARMYLGSYDTELDAARAFDRAALSHWGDFANLNLPHERSDREEELSNGVPLQRRNPRRHGWKCNLSPQERSRRRELLLSVSHLGRAAMKAKRENFVSV